MFTFFNKTIPICFKFFRKNVFWSKIIFDENFDDMINFFKNFTKVVFCSKNAKWSLNLTRFCVSKAENSSDPQRKNYEFSSFQVAKMSIPNAKISVTLFASKCHVLLFQGKIIIKVSLSRKDRGEGVCLVPFTV